MSTEMGTPVLQQGGAATPGRSAWPRAQRNYTSRRIAVLQFATVLALLAGWELVSRGMDAEFWISSPSGVVAQLDRWVASGVIWSSLRATLIETGAGFVIGAAAGAVVGFMLGRIRILGLVLEPLILALYTLPKVALAPLFVLWFGIDVLPKVMFAALLVFFLVFFTTFQGARNTDETLIDIARVMGASRWDIMRKIVLPHSAIWVFAGFRIGLPYALIGAVVGEFIAAREGIGFMIKEASSLFNTNGVFAGLIVLMGLALLMLAFLRAVEKRVLKWQTAGTDALNGATAAPMP